MHQLTEFLEQGSVACKVLRKNGNIPPPPCLLAKVCIGKSWKTQDTFVAEIMPYTSQYNYNIHAVCNVVTFIPLW